MRTPGWSWHGVGSPSTSLYLSAFTPLSASYSLPPELGMKSWTVTLVFKVTGPGFLLQYASSCGLYSCHTKGQLSRLSLPFHASKYLHTMDPLLERLLSPQSCHSCFKFSEESPPPGGLPRLLEPLVPPLSGCLCPGSLLPDNGSVSLTGL